MHTKNHYAPLSVVHNTVVQITTQSSHYENTDNSIAKKIITCNQQNRYFSLPANMNGIQRRALLSS